MTLRTSAVGRSRRWLWTLLTIVLVGACTVGSPGPGRSVAEELVADRPPENTATIREIAGVTTEQYPLQFGRPFRQGEIPGSPQVVADGVPLPTQADVKSRWPDGSVRHAVLSVILPRLRAGQTVEFGFRSQTDALPGVGETSSGMLSDRYDFDATMALGAGERRVTASARDMVAAGAMEHWLSGPIATSVILADHSLRRAFDVGFDAHRSLRPIFHATFWPGLGRVRVRFVGEIASTESLQDLDYELFLTVGRRQATPLVAGERVHHQANARWTREAWIGGAPSPVAIDHNLPYLASTTLLPNYDPRRRVPERAVARAAARWEAAAKGFFAPGNWARRMGTAGGREDIGPYPAWTVRWLYTGDPRAAEQAFGNADLAAAWPVHFREGRADKYLDREGRVPGLGRVVSISTRPSLHALNLGYSYTKPPDRVTPVGPRNRSPWAPDQAHQPDPFSPQYLLTGDYWYLEEMLFWASWGAAYPNGAATNSGCGRGPTGAEGGLPGMICASMRAQAWVLRNRAHAAALTPDDMPEKAYFTQLLEDVVAIWEGSRGITDTPFRGNAAWEWGRTVDRKSAFRGDELPPLRSWERGNGAFVQGPLERSRAAGAISTWEQHFLTFALGRARELGFPTGRLLSWIAPHLIGQVTAPGADPYLIGANRTPTVRRDGEYFTDWAEVRRAYAPDFDSRRYFADRLRNKDHGYSIVAIAAGAMIAGEPGGQAAWDWIRVHALDLVARELDHNPKWAILPRPPGQPHSRPAARPGGGLR
jgi:hypothetical protein